MENNFEKKEEEKKERQIYKVKDLDNYINATGLSAFGRIIVSNKKTNPIIGFGKSTREKMAKVYQNKQLCKSQFLGKTSQGPKYQVTDKFNYIINPKWTISGGSNRNTFNIKEKYDYYTSDAGLDPISANKYISRNTKVTKFSKEPKVNFYLIK